jgi:arylsulfatase
MKVLTVLTALILSPWISITAHAEESLAGTKPNIILMMTDDQGYGPVGRHGHPFIRTPNMDKLYDTSTRFTRFLVCPTCSPTRSAIMTGRHPMRNGVTHTILERERMTLDATILPQVLKPAGYTTAIFGKWHLGDEDPYQPHNRGFDKAFIHGAGGIGQAYNCSCADVPNNSYFDPVIKEDGTFVKTHGFCTDVFFTAAQGWIKQVKDGDQPFFAYIATNAPHGPFLAPEKNKKRFLEMGMEQKHAGFYGMVENIDENVGRLLANLDKWGLMDNTVIIFMSDNGTTGGGAGRAGQRLGKSEYKCYNAGMKGMKGSPDEGGVRVPFFVRWDGHIKQGQEIDSIAAHIDILPTLAALADAKIPKSQVEGRNLLPLIEHPDLDWEDRYFVTHVCRWKTGADPNDSKFNKMAIRNQRYRFVNNNALYDMVQDPGQKTNVIDQHPDIVAEMRAFYEGWWQKTLPMLVNEDAKMSPTRPFWVEYNKQKESPGIPDWQPPEL